MFLATLSPNINENIFLLISAKGAAIVNCDFIAHDLYKPGLPLNQTIAETFGTQVITEDGEVDRKKLGNIVFGEKVGVFALYKLNVGIQNLMH